MQRHSSFNDYITRAMCICVKDKDLQNILFIIYDKYAFIKRYGFSQVDRCLSVHYSVQGRLHVLSRQRYRRNAQELAKDKCKTFCKWIFGFYSIGKSFTSMTHRCRQSRGRTYRYYQLRHVVRTQRIHLIVDFPVDDRERDLVYRDGGKTEVKYKVDD